jgi:hypothetical protein
LRKVLRRLRSPIGVIIVLLVRAASIAVFATISATVNGEPGTSPYQGFVTVLQPAGSSFSVDQVKLIAAAAVPGGPGQKPALSYDVNVCGTQPFKGVLLIGGNAHLSLLSGIPALDAGIAMESSSVENLPDLTFSDVGTGAVIDLGPPNVVMPSVSESRPVGRVLYRGVPDPCIRGGHAVWPAAEISAILSVSERVSRSCASDVPRHGLRLLLLLLDA